MEPLSNYYDERVCLIICESPLHPKEHSQTCRSYNVVSAVLAAPSAVDFQDSVRGPERCSESLKGLQPGSEVSGHVYRPRARAGIFANDLKGVQKAVSRHVSQFAVQLELHILISRLIGAEGSSCKLELPAQGLEGRLVRSPGPHS